MRTPITAENIDTNNNAMGFSLAKTVGKYFQLNNKEMDTIITEVKKVVSSWKKIAEQTGISRGEQELMSTAFRF